MSQPLVTEALDAVDEPVAMLPRAELERMYHRARTELREGRVALREAVGLLRDVEAAWGRDTEGGPARGSRILDELAERLGRKP